MALPTTQEELEEVKAAISKIVTGAQGYAIGNRRVDRAQLATLQKRETLLETKLRRENSGGINVKRAVPRG